MEMRDRSGFDAHGRNESDRGDVTFAPGMLLAYTDENHGYGNVGTDDPPAQSPLDSQPEPGSDDAEPRRRGVHGGRRRLALLRRRGRARRQLRRRVERGRPVALRLRLPQRSTSRAMAGQDIDDDARNLVGDVAFKTGDGCGPFNYGNTPDGGRRQRRADRGRAGAADHRRRSGQPVSFDGSGSFDDRDAPEDLGYAWDFDGNGSDGRDEPRGAPRVRRGRQLRREADRARLRRQDELGDGADHRDRRGGGAGRRPGERPGGGPCAPRQRLQVAEGQAEGAAGCASRSRASRSGRVVADVFRAAKGAQGDQAAHASPASRTAGRRSPTRRARCGRGDLLHPRLAAGRGQRLDTRRTAFTRSARALQAAQGVRAARRLRRDPGVQARAPGVRRAAPAARRLVHAGQGAGARGSTCCAGARWSARSAAACARPLRTHRLKIKPRSSPRGEYTVRLRVGKVTRKLSARGSGATLGWVARDAPVRRGLDRALCRGAVLLGWEGRRDAAILLAAVGGIGLSVFTLP